MAVFWRCRRAGYAVAAHEAADGAVGAEAVEAVAQVGVVVVEPVYLGGGGLVPAAEELELLLLAGESCMMRSGVMGVRCLVKVPLLLSLMRGRDCAAVGYGAGV